MIVKALLAGLAGLFLLAVIVWIGRQCWLDSKDDFRMVWNNVFKKKNAD